MSKARRSQRPSGSLEYYPHHHHPQPHSLLYPISRYRIIFFPCHLPHSCANCVQTRNSNILCTKSKRNYLHYKTLTGGNTFSTVSGVTYKCITPYFYQKSHYLTQVALHLNLETMFDKKAIYISILFFYDLLMCPEFKNIKECV